MTNTMKSVCLVLVCILLSMCVLFVARSFSQDTNNFKDLQFATTNTALKFFDPHSGKLYVYSTESGVLINIWTLKELGEKLEKYYPRRFDYKENF